MLNKYTVLLSVLAVIVMSFFVGARFESNKTPMLEIKPVSDFVMIDDNIYMKRSIVEIQRCIDTMNIEFVFVVVESELGKICFEKYIPKDVNIDEWILSFLMNFEGWE